MNAAVLILKCLEAEAGRSIDQGTPEAVALGFLRQADLEHIVDRGPFLAALTTTMFSRATRSAVCAAGEGSSMPPINDHYQPSQRYHITDRFVEMESIFELLGISLSVDSLPIPSAVSMGFLQQVRSAKRLSRLDQILDRGQFLAGLTKVLTRHREGREDDSYRQHTPLMGTFSPSGAGRTNSVELIMELTRRLLLGGAEGRAALDYLQHELEPLIFNREHFEKQYMHDSLGYTKSVQHFWLSDELSFFFCHLTFSCVMHCSRSHKKSMRAYCFHLQYKFFRCVIV